MFKKKWSFITECQFYLGAIPGLSMLPSNHLDFSLRVFIILFCSIEQGILIRLSSTGIYVSPPPQIPLPPKLI